MYIRNPPADKRLDVCVIRIMWICNPDVADITGTRVTRLQNKSPRLCNNAAWLFVSFSIENGICHNIRASYLDTLHYITCEPR